MRKNSISLLFLLLFLNCYYHFLPDNIELPKVNEKILNKKIALIGFCGVMDSTFRIKQEKDPILYDFFSKDNPEVFSENLTRNLALNDSEKKDISNYKISSYITICANDFKKKITFGRPILQIKEKGLSRDIPADNVKSFVLSYLEEVKLGGQKEILDLITIKDKSLQFKERDVDYYVVGIIKPAFSGASSFPNYLLALGSLMLFPYFGTEITYSKFLVYDNNLNLIKKFEYTNEYVTAMSWWIIFLPSSESQPISKYNHLIGHSNYYPQVYGENDIATFSKDFQKYLVQVKDK